MSTTSQAGDQASNPASDQTGDKTSDKAGEPATEQPPMAVRVTADRVLCRRGGDGEKRSRAGILIPATAVSTDRTGLWAEVADVGPLVRSVEEGDSVLFLPESAIDVDIHGEAYVIVRERDVHAIASAVDEPSSTGLYL